MVESLLREQEGAGPNPVIPIMNDKGTSIEAVFAFYGPGSESHPCIAVLKIQADSFVNYISLIEAAVSGPLTISLSLALIGPRR